MSPTKRPFVFPTYNPPILPTPIIPEDDNRNSRYPPVGYPSRVSDDQPYFSDNWVQPKTPAKDCVLPPLSSVLRLEPDNTSTDYQQRNGSQVNDQGLAYQQLYQPHHEENRQYQVQRQQQPQHPQPYEGQYHLEQPYQTLQGHPSHAYQAAQHPQPQEKFHQNFPEFPNHGYQAAHQFPNPPYYQHPEQINSHQQSPQDSCQHVDQHYCWGIMRDDSGAFSEPQSTTMTIPTDLHSYPPRELPTARTHVCHPAPSATLPQPALVPYTTNVNPPPRGDQPRARMARPTTPGRTLPHQAVYPPVPGVTQRTAEEEAVYQQRQQAILRARVANQEAQVQYGSHVEPEPVNRGSHEHQKKNEGTKPQKPEQATFSFPTRQESTPLDPLPDMSADVQSSVSQPAPWHHTDNTTSSTAIDASPMTLQVMTASNVQSQTSGYSPQSPTAPSEDNSATTMAQEALAAGVQMNGTAHPNGGIESSDNAQVNGNICPVVNGDTHGSPTSNDACPAGSTYGAAAGAQT